MISSIACIAFKISSLIIVLPIFAIIFINLIIDSNTKEIILGDLIEIIRSKIFILTSFSLLLILFSRYQITGNFAYPLLTNIFNKNDFLINQFSDLLQSYGKDLNSTIKIFIPLNFF